MNKYVNTNKMKLKKVRLKKKIIEIKWKRSRGCERRPSAFRGGHDASPFAKAMVMLAFTALKNKRGARR